MEIIDYNGEGRWTKDSIIQRYFEYCKRFHVTPCDLKPRESVAGERKWIYPVMDTVIAGVKQGDKACQQIAVEFIEEDQKIPFGKGLKSNAARALRQNHLALSETDKVRIRKRVVSLLVRGLVPHEFREYAKLLRKIGLADCKEQLAAIDKTNPYVEKFCKYLIES